MLRALMPMNYGLGACKFVVLVAQTITMGPHSPVLVYHFRRTPFRSDSDASLHTDKAWNKNLGSSLVKAN